MDLIIENIEIAICVCAMVVFSAYAMLLYTAPSVKNIVFSAKSYVPIKKIYSEAQTGDLIFMSGDSWGERLCRRLGNSAFSHVGMIIREKANEKTGVPEEIYIWEADLGQSYRDGPRVIKLRDKLARYTGENIIGWKQLSGFIKGEKLEIPSEKIMKIVEEYKNHSFDFSMIRWLFGNWASKKEGKVFCSELIALTLQHPSIYILSNKVPAHSYSPGSFGEFSINDHLLGEWMYSDMIYSRRR